MDAQKTSPAENAPAALPKSYWRRWMNLAREIWNDHEFWIRALAIKGGASAVALLGVAAIPYLLPLPLVVAAAGISACVGLTGLGLYGVFVGAAGAGDKLADLYAKTVTGKPRQQKPPRLKRLHQKLLNSPRVQKWMARPLVQKFLNSRPWQFTRALAQKEEDVFMAALAGTGSIFWGTVSIIALAAVLPAIAVGSIFTFGTALAVGGTISGAYGLYLSAQSLVKSLRAKRGAKKKTTDGEIQPPAESPAAAQPLETKLTPDFKPAAEKKEPGEKPATSPEPKTPPPSP